MHRIKTLSISLFLLIFISCMPKDANNNRMNFATMLETQLTHDEKGHFLYHTQYFSPDDQWIVYDIRNDGPDIGKTCCIEIVNVESGAIRTVYQTKNQTAYGPGVGAPAFHPGRNRVVFIHGVNNCSKENPYGFTRRTGVAVDLEHPNIPIFLDARNINSPYTPGALRGGTHAHQWSGDGEWLSYTYNDDVIANLEKKGGSLAKDLRMVGVMMPLRSVNVPIDSIGENNKGELFSFIVTELTETPAPGSDQIDRACEEGWVGKDGYFKTDGTRQKRALSFLGNTRNKQGDILTEVFIVDIPENVSAFANEPQLTGSGTERPQPPSCVQQKRLTYTSDRKYPGIQGPRQWMRSKPDGSIIFFTLRDDAGYIQIHGISPNAGEIKQYTNNKFSIDTDFSVSPNGKYLAYGCQQNVYVSDIESGITQQVSPDAPSNASGLQSIAWSNEGTTLAYNRLVESNNKKYYQIFILK